MTSPPTKTSRLAALVLIGAILWIGYVFVSSFGRTSPEIQASIIAASAAVGAALWTQSHIRKREREARLHDKKLNTYTQLVEVLFDVIAQQKSGQKTNETRLMRAMLECKKAFVMWASADFILEWTEMENRAEKGSTEEKVLAFDSILRLMRKDLGHDDSALPPGSLIGVLLTSSSREDLARSMAGG